MNTLKTLIKKHFSGFTFFYRILRYRVFMALAVGILVGVLDGFGLAMFLPLLQLVGGESEATGEGMGQLDFLVTSMQDWGLVLNIKVILIALITFFLLKGLVAYLGQYYQIRIRQYFLRRMRLNLLRDFNQIKFQHFITWDLGRIQNSFTTETERITAAFTNYFATMNQAVLVVVYMLFAFTVDPKFSLLVILGGALSNILFRYFYKLSKKSSRNLSAGNSLFHGLVSQFVGNFKYLKATGRNQFYAESLEKTIFKIESENTRLGKYGAILSAAREPIMIVVVGFVIIIQTEILGAALAPIMASLLFFYRALSALNILQNAWNRYIVFSGSLENVDDFAKDLQRSKEKNKGKLEFDALQNELCLQKISFSYGDTPILKDIDLTIKKNESIALVGESGSGKTTLINVISGLLRPEQGAYQVDGKELKEWNIHSFQKRVGFIAQEPVIFNATIYENVSFWADKNTKNQEQFWKAINQAALSEFFNDLPEKENTMLGANGINLSGGQRQRIAIARELFRDIDILILDEATSALDTETERYIQTSIEALKGKYTIISVAHRLSTVKNADRIVMMDRGRIEHDAPFEQLVKQSNRFKKMVELQEI